MTDKELLELAAKAAEIDLDWNIPPNSKTPWRMTGKGDDRGPADEWNPLTDDGDALRLAVKLNLGVTVDGYEVEVVTPLLCTFVEKATMGYSIEEATRRAIVRAAAEIGKEMK